MPGFFRKPFKVGAKKVRELAPQLPTLIPHYTRSLDKIKKMSEVNASVLDYMTPERKRYLNNHFKYGRSLIKLQEVTFYEHHGSHSLLDFDYLIDQFNLEANTLNFDANKKKASKSKQSDWDKLSFPEKLHYYLNHFPKLSAKWAEDLRNGISSVNYHRLYGVWTNIVISALEILIDGISIENLERYQGRYSYVTSFLSYYFYFFRFFLEAYLLFRAVFGPWTEEEQKLAEEIPWIERLIFNANKRKFLLINDLFWSVINCLCAILLIGKELVPGSDIITFGDLGNYLTVVLLLMDVLVALWALREATDNYEIQMDILYQELSHLKETKHNLKRQLQGIAYTNSYYPKGHEDRYHQNMEQLGILDREIKEQKNLIKHSKLDWKYKKYNLQIALGYSSLLLFSFIIVIGFALPAATVPLLFANTFFLLGSSLAFSLNVGSEILYRYLAHEKATEELELMTNDCEFLWHQFKSFHEKDLTDPLNQKELAYLYLEIVVLMTDKKNKKVRLPYEQGMAAIKSISQAIIPLLLLLTFSTVTTGAAIGFVLGVMAFLMLSYLTLKYAEPTWVSTSIDKPVLSAMIALNQDKKNHNMLTLDYFNQHIRLKENSMFVHACHDFKDMLLAFVPKVFLIACSPVTIPLLLIGFVYSMIKSYQAHDNNEQELKHYCSDYDSEQADEITEGSGEEDSEQKSLFLQ